MSRGPRKYKPKKVPAPAPCDIVCRSCHYSGPAHIMRSRIRCCPECHSMNVCPTVVVVEIQAIPDGQLSQLTL